MPELSTKYDAIVFDNDGVIVEPTPQERIIDAVVLTFREFGYDPDRGYAAWTVDTAAGPAETVGTYDIDPETFWAAREDAVAAEQIRLVREDGKQPYDDTGILAELDAPLGLVSNNQAGTVDFLVDYHDLSVFDTVYGREHTATGAARRKPNPYYIQRALADLSTTNALYVGDSQKDIVAAHRAGIDSAFLRRDHVNSTDLTLQPTYDVSNLIELVQAISNSADEPVVSGHE
jgi:haloacid dehalogenase superfamily, subfamily IA, variant 1 with third motif having Dx(3-4)D or Dx(3-4)E